VALHATVAIHGDSMTVDLAGSSPQVKAGINSPLPFSKSAVYGAIRLIMDPAIPNSSGYFRPIAVQAPEGTVVNPRSPAACGARGITGFRIMDAVLGALAQAVPERVPADGEGGNSIISIGGYDHQGRAFVYVDLIAGARGGRPNGDGPEGVPHPGSNISNTPVEIAEAELPVRIEHYGLLPDTGGAGRYRGALAQVRQVRCLAEDAVLQIRSDKRHFPPYGLQGGQPGTPSLNILNPGPEQKVLPTLAVSRIREGEVLRHVLAGGGGWGDPLERDPERVWRDAWNEKLSVDYARREYGVVIDPVTLQLDRQETERLRQELRAQRKSHSGREK
jgi:N-methylhydantoinase B